MGQFEAPARAFATITHARLRAEQGDLPGARRILREILHRSPDHAQARELLRRLAAPAPTPPPSPGEIRRRVARLESWLDRITRAP